MWGDFVFFGFLTLSFPIKFLADMPPTPFWDRGVLPPAPQVFYSKPGLPFLTGKAVGICIHFASYLVSSLPPQAVELVVLSASLKSVQFLLSWKNYAG